MHQAGLSAGQTGWPADSPGCLPLAGADQLLLAAGGRRGCWRGLSPAQNLAGSGDPEFHYRFGIDLFIAGVQAMAPAR